MTFGLDQRQCVTRPIAPEATPARDRTSRAPRTENDAVLRCVTPTTPMPRDPTGGDSRSS